MSHIDYLTSDLLSRALHLRDLTDPAQGGHAIQALLDAVVIALQSEWHNTVRYVRSSPIVPVRENYDRLGYDPDDVTRARRYTRYISPTVMLRSHTSAALPTALEDYVRRNGVDELIVAPGLVYRRDAVDRNHVGEPHQVDFWRIRNTPDTDDSDMLTMIGLLVDAVLPDAEWTVTDVTHPYTVGGRQIDVIHNGEWLELAECGRIHPDVLRGSGLDPEQWSGLAVGMGLERALMLRKGIPDIRYLRAEDPGSPLRCSPSSHGSTFRRSRRPDGTSPSSWQQRKTRRHWVIGSAARSGTTPMLSSPSRCSAAPATMNCLRQRALASARKTARSISCSRSSCAPSTAHSPRIRPTRSATRSTEPCTKARCWS